MARKKEDRDGGKYKRLAIKSRKSHEGKDHDAEIVRAQLLPLGLCVRSVPGDGNCLFRALGDQLDGHMGNHYRHRQDTTNYMLENREDFQPFVEDDIPFTRHISQLSQLGTYAGNDAIVAFARLHQVVIVIHQANTPLWQIKGWDENDVTSKSSNRHKGKSVPVKRFVRQLHIAYHGGDHYDSVRRLGDTSHVPANILIDVESSTNEASYLESNPEMENEALNFTRGDGAEDEATDIEREAMERSGCDDLQTARHLLYNNCGNLEAAVEDLVALSTGTVNGVQQRAEPTAPTATRAKSHFNRKQLEKIRKQERKRASEIRKKQTNAPSNEAAEETVVIGKMQCLNI